MSSSRIVSLLVMGVLLWAVAGVAQESDLGAEILRDKYVLGLSQALKAEDYPKALGFIEKLDEPGRRPAAGDRVFPRRSLFSHRTL